MTKDQTENQTEIQAAGQNNSPYPAPLNDSQMNVYLDQIEESGKGTKYNILGIKRYEKGQIDSRSLAQAARTAMLHFEVSHLYIEQKEGLPVWMHQKEVALEIPILSAEESQIQQVGQDFMQPFDLSKAPLCRGQIVETEKSVYLMVDCHHMISDGSSEKVLFQAITAAYEHQPLPAEEMSLAQESYLEKQEQFQKIQRQNEDYFLKRLEGADVDSNLPVDKPDEPISSVGKTVQMMVDVSFDKFNQTAKRYGVTKGNILIGAFAYALAKATCQEESLFCTVSSGRHDLRLEHTMGMFVRTFPFYAKFDENGKIEDFLHETHEQMVQGVQHDFASFARLAKELGIRTDIMFVYQGSLFQDFDLMDSKEVQSNLAFLVFKRDAGFEVRVTYRECLYEEANIRRFIELFSFIVRGFTECETFQEISLQSENDRALIAQFNQTKMAVPQEETIVSLFRKQAKKTPQNIAVVYQDRKLTYAELDEITDRIAAYLQDNGVGRGDFVSILLPRCEWMPICALGVLKSAAAYQPLDPTYPPERLAFMVQDSSAKLLIADRSLLTLLPEYSGAILCTDEIEALPKKICCNAPTPNDRFILLYTSGTTGIPKGSVLCHRNIVSMCTWYAQMMNLNENSRATAYASFGFDANMMDTYPTLLSGAQLHVLPEDMRLDMVRLDEYFCKNKITNTVMTTQVGRQFALFTSCKTLTHLMVGGEKLVPLTPPEWMSFYNGYGPSECTICTNAYRVKTDSKRLPIGRPVANTKVYVLDKQMRPLPIGAAGELCVAGFQVGAGYLNRPEQTKAAFVPNPFCKEDGFETLYHTGDIVRWLDDGNVEFIGRRDGQVKVRGFRIELTEVEQVIREYPGIEDATVAAFDAPGGGKFVAAYVVSDQTISIDALNEFIAERKPPYMVPAVTMQIDRIPLTQNHKVNRRALPVPTRQESEVVPPKTPMQKQLCEMVENLIGTGNIGIRTDLYEAGLSSIASIQLVVELSKKFDVAVQIRDLKENYTVEALEAFLQKAGQQTVHEKQSEYPLSKTQQGIFVECIANPNSTIYNIPLLLKLSDAVDEKRLAKALMQAVDAHPYFKTILEMNEDGDVVAKRHDKEKASVLIQTVEKLPEPQQLVRPFALFGKKLYRITLYHTEQGIYLMMDFHHLICDGTSLVVLLNDTDRAYKGETIQSEVYTGFEFALDEEDARKSEAYDQAKTYYDALFSGCDAECLPASDNPAQVSGGVGHFQKDNQTLLPRLRSWCEQHTVTENAFFNTVFGFVLSRYCCREDAIYATIYNGRSDSRLVRAGGMFVKTLPVKVVFDGEMTVAKLVQKTASQLSDSMANDLFSFAEISHTYGIKADVLFSYQGDQFEFNKLAGEPAKQIPLTLDTQKAPLDVTISKVDGALRYEVEYAANRYCAEFVQEFVDCMEAAAESFLCSQKVCEIEMLSEHAKEQLTSFNDREFLIEKTTCNKLLEEQAKAHPDRVAVIADKKQMTYQTLNNNANKVAHSLLAYHAKPDQMIGVMMPRVGEAYVAREGIVKAGAAYMPLDPGYPDDRVRYIFEDSGSKFVVTTQKLASERAALFESLGIQVMTVEEMMQTENIENPVTSVTPENLCYVLYTSGSTGRPKGCMIEHHSLVNLVNENVYNLQAREFCEGIHTSLALAALTFDVSVLEEALVLYHGNTLVMAGEDEIHNPLLLAKLMEAHHVDVMSCTPSFMNSILDVPQIQKVLRTLTAIDIGAESFPVPMYRKMRELGITAQIYNGYGPTEATITATMAKLTSEKITIGQPLTNMKIYMLDSFGHILPPTVPGELTILGEGVGRGYVGKEKLTREKFITVCGMPAYRSGDFAKWNRNGLIDFIGRMDNQVKLRGLRVELDEIEAVMDRYPGITRSVVVVKENDTGEQFLCGYFTANESVDLEKLTTHLKQSLTAYMVPSILMQLEKLPINHNGKVDKKALPEPVSNQTARKIVTPRTPLQAKLCQLFADALKLDAVGIDEDFFSLGGTSLSVSKIAVRAMVEGINIAYGDLFRYRTVEALEQYLLSLDESEQIPDSPEESKQTFAEMPVQRKQSEFTHALQYNTPEEARQIQPGEIGDVLLTGATGYLGIHVLHVLLKKPDRKVYCLLRRGRASNVTQRLKTMLAYYFTESFDDLFGKRLFVVEGDLTDRACVMELDAYKFQTVINCAASVKHFSEDDAMERINVVGVENLIALCEQTHSRLIQTSTVSIAGENVNDAFPPTRMLHENELDFGQDRSNVYVDTKFRAEKAILTEIEAGRLDAKIMRLGNLMSREADGEFQINFHTNNFMRGLRGYAAVGKFPIFHMDDVVEFSPIDYTAEAIVRLSGTDSRFTVFHPHNSHTVEMGNVIEALNKQDVTIEPVDDAAFEQAMKEAMKDPNRSERAASLISYQNSDKRQLRSFIGDENTFTTKALYQLGFCWPITDNQYLTKVVEALRTLDFFE